MNSLLMLIFSKYTTVNKALVLMNAFPFIILLVSIICLISILLQHQSSIDELYVSMQYYSKSSNALFLGSMTLPRNFKVVPLKKK